MKKIIIIGVIICGIISLMNCKSKKKESKPANLWQAPVELHCSDFWKKYKQNNLNIGILIDLSDRIEDKKYPNTIMSFKDRDLGYIKSIVKSFQNHVLHKKIQLMNDQIQVFLEPPPSKMDIDKKLQALKFTLTKENVDKKIIDNIPNQYDTMMRSIYNLAQKQHNYIGSDAWRFFKNKVKNYFIKACNRNILIILTDGYLYHKNNIRKEGNKTTYLTRIPSKINGNDWKNTMKKKGYGFISINNKLNDLEVLVIGIVNHDKKNPYGEDIIKEYWQNWLKDMGIKNFEIIRADLPVNVNNVIKKFIGAQE